MKSKIIYCLDNECGGPNLENLIGIGTSIAVFTFLQGFRNSIFRFVYNTMGYVVHLWNV